LYGLATRNSISKSIAYSRNEARIPVAPRITTYLMTVWNSSLLIYSRIDVRLDELSGEGFRHTLTDVEVRDAIWSFQQFPRLVRELTSGRAVMQYDVHQIERSLNSLSCLNNKAYWPSPDDTREEIDRFTPPGPFASIFILWPQRNLSNGTSVPSRGWGLAIRASSWSNAATYAAVASAESWMWQIPVVGEIWLHEWLHGVCAHFAERGYLMPGGDADGGSRHGYSQSPVSGWIDYYRDLMSGNVLEGGKRTGIPTTAW
jgi:hypothetical protein